MTNNKQPISTKISFDEMILANNIVTTFDSEATGLNNNTIVLGTTGSGKSMSVTEPQIMHTFNNSLVVPLTKRKIADEYANLLRSRGYFVNILDFTSPHLSTAGFDPIEHISDENDIVTIARQIVYTSKASSGTRDPYWDEAAISLVSAEIAALIESWIYEMEKYGTADSPEPTLENLLELHRRLKFFESDRSGFTTSTLDTLFERLERENPVSYAVQCWSTVKGLASKTVSCIHSTVNVAYSQVFGPKIREVAAKRPFNVGELGERKSALFIITSPVEKSSKLFSNIIYSTLFKELFEKAEQNKTYRLDVPVHLICDDFACGSTIPDFAEYVSVIRSAGMSVTLLIQSETQLEQMYGVADAITIVNNCDRMVYMGGNDIGTCMGVAKRANVPFESILNMPLEKVYVFERGKGAVYASRYKTKEDPVWIMMHERAIEEELM